MDYDDLVWSIAGPEGGPRYVRVGVFLIVMGMVTALSMTMLPIYSIGDDHLSFGDLGDEPMGDPLGIPNAYARSPAKWAIAGGVLTILMGTVLVLEGRRVISLRRFIVWDAETRATALYSLATVLALPGLVGGTALVGVAGTLPDILLAGTVVEQDATSTAGLVAMGVMGLVVLTMLGMAYYSCVLSVYRRGGSTPRTRALARFSMYVAGLSALGLVLVAGPNLFSSLYEVPSALAQDLGTGPTEIIFKYTHTRVSALADPALENLPMKALDLHLNVVELLFMVSVLLGLGGMVGVSAYSLGSETLRVRRTVSLPVLALVATVVALLFGTNTVLLAPAAILEATEVTELVTGVGTGLAGGLAVILMALLVSLLYLRALGLEFALDALAFWKQEEEEDRALETPPASAEPDHILGGGEAEAPTGVRGVRGGKLLPRNLFLVIVAILVVTFVLTAAIGLTAWRRPGGGEGVGGGRVPIDIEALPLVYVSTDVSGYLSEGDSQVLDAHQAFGTDPEDGVYLFNYVGATLTWVDEPDDSLLWTNQGDTFSGVISDEADIAQSSGEETNLHGLDGELHLSWHTDEYWLSWGNLSLVDPGEADVFEDANVLIEVLMEDAGDQVTRLGRTRADDGNQFQVTIMIHARYYDRKA